MISSGKHHGGRTLLLCCLGMILIQGVPRLEAASASESSSLTADALFNGWESNWASIKTMRISYMERFWQPASLPLSSKGKVVEFQHVDRIEAGKRYHMRYSIAENNLKDPKSLMEHAFDGKTTRDYYAQDNSGLVSPGLTGRDVEEKNSIRRFQLANRIDLGKGAEMVPWFTVIYKNMGLTHTVRPNVENVSGEPCHVLECGSGEGAPSYTVWLAPNKSMMVMKYVERDSEGKIIRELEVEKVGQGIGKAGPYWFPAKARESFAIEKQGMARYELTVHHFEPNIAVSPADFTFQFPKGTFVFDKIAGISYTVGSDNPENEISIIKDKDETKPPSESRPSPQEAVETIPVRSQPGKNTTSLPPPSHSSNQDRNSGTTAPADHRVIAVLLLGLVVVVFAIGVWRTRSARHSR